MNLSDLFKAEEDFQLEKRTLVVLRWIAIFGQLITVYTVYFALHFELPLFYCSAIILFGILTNLFLQFYFIKCYKCLKFRHLNYEVSRNFKNIFT